MTHALDIRCQNCGSPLQVGEGIRFVTCTYCNTALQIVRDAATVHTEVLDKIEARTAEMSGSLKNIELQNEIERLDREWQMWRETNLHRTKSGKIQEPAPLAAGIFGTIAAGFVIAWIAATSWITSEVNTPLAFIFPLFGVFVLAVMIYNVVTAMTAGAGYKEAREAYESKRSTLLSQLADTRDGAGM